MSTDDQRDRLLGGDDVHERATRIESARKIREELAALAASAERGRNHGDDVPERDVVLDRDASFRA